MLSISLQPRRNTCRKIQPFPKVRVLRRTPTNGAVATAPEKESPAGAGLSVQRSKAGTPYIMPSIPPMPPGGIPGPLSFFGFSATVASVVISNPAIDAAF